ncbi:hypothetical protein D3C87_1666580 [compost metagenome]
MARTSAVSLRAQRTPREQPLRVDSAQMSSFSMRSITWAKRISRISRTFRMRRRSVSRLSPPLPRPVAGPASIAGVQAPRITAGKNVTHHRLSILSFSKLTLIQIVHTWKTFVKNLPKCVLTKRLWRTLVKKRQAYI